MGAHLTGFYNKWYTNEEEMKEIVYAGPVATTVYVSVHTYINTENADKKLSRPHTLVTMLVEFMRTADVAKLSVILTVSGL